MPGFSHIQPAPHGTTSASREVAARQTVCAALALAVGAVLIRIVLTLW